MVSKGTDKKSSETKVKTERVMVAVPELLIEKLNEEKNKKGYPSVQIIINEAIRERYFGLRFIAGLDMKKLYHGAKRGPKPKFDHEKMVSGENVLKFGKE